jgi:hypothetical protein
MSKFSKIIEDKIKLRQAKVDATEKEWLYQKERLRMYEESQQVKEIEPTATTYVMLQELIDVISRDTNLDHNSRTGIITRMRDIQEKL